MNEPDTISNIPDRAGPATAAPVARAPRHRWIVSIFGDISRGGSLPPHPRMSPFSLFGDIDLDLRQASLPVGEVVIRAVAPFGNVTVLVPPNVSVDAGGFALFGSKRIDVRDTTGDGPIIRVSGYTLFGSVKVWSP